MRYIEVAKASLFGVFALLIFYGCATRHVARARCSVQAGETSSRGTFWLIKPGGKCTLELNSKIRSGSEAKDFAQAWSNMLQTVPEFKKRPK